MDIEVLWYAFSNRVSVMQCQEFIKLSEETRYLYLLRFGKHLLDFKLTTRVYKLFDLNGFFVEVELTRDQRFIKKIRSKHLIDIDKYLEVISLESLFP